MELFSDASLQSALGRKDGNVYETLLSWTRQIPLNQESRKSGGLTEQVLSTIRQCSMPNFEWSFILKPYINLY